MKKKLTAAAFKLLKLVIEKKQYVVKQRIVKIKTNVAYKLTKINPHILLKNIPVLGMFFYE